LISASDSDFYGEEVELVGSVTKGGVPHSLLVRRAERPYLVEISASQTNIAEMGDLDPEPALKLDADQMLAALEIISKARSIAKKE